MNNNELKHLNLLGHKRNLNSIIGNDESKTDEEKKMNENNSKKSSSKNYDFFNPLDENERNNLEGINQTRADNTNTNTENKIDKKICQRCNCRDNLLLFNSLKSILDYLSRKNILIFKNIFSGEKIIFDSPKIICLNCLLTIAKNRTEFEKYIRGYYKKNDDNDNLLNKLLEYSNLKNVDYNKKNKYIKPNEFNEKYKDISEKFFFQDEKDSSSVNNKANNIINNNINNRNLNFDFLNNLNCPFLPLINYNMPFTQNIANLNIRNNFNNNINSLFNINTFFKNPEMKDNNTNQNNPQQFPLLNISDILQNSLLKTPPSLFSQNNNGILNLSQLPLFNKNYSIEKNNKKDNNTYSIPNNINNNNDKGKISKDDNKILEQENIKKNFTVIENKNFDEFFDIINNLYHRLLDIKNSRDLNLNSENTLENDIQILSPNNPILLNSNPNIINNQININNRNNNYKNK